MLDLEEFFIPKGINRNFQDVFASIKPSKNHVTDPRYRRKVTNSTIENIWKEDKENKGHGWSKDHAHPYCYITVPGEVVLSPSESRDPNLPWIGQR